MIRVSGAKCHLCGDTIYSRSGHDFHRCYCENIFVDGGPALTDDIHPEKDENSYWRFGWTVEDSYEITKVVLDIKPLDLDHVVQTLYDDWNHDKNKYGCVKDDSYTDEMREAAKKKIDDIVTVRLAKSNLNDD
jgi:hypothetical protein